MQAEEREDRMDDASDTFDDDEILELFDRRLDISYDVLLVLILDELLFFLRRPALRSFSNTNAELIGKSVSFSPLSINSIGKSKYDELPCRSFQQSIKMSEETDDKSNLSRDATFDMTLGREGVAFASRSGL